MLDDMKFEFKSAEERKSARKVIPAGTQAKVQIRPDKNGKLPSVSDDLNIIKGQYGPFARLLFEVVEGEYAREWATATINFDAENHRFVEFFEAVTGADLSQGGGGGMSELLEKLANGVFLVQLAPETRKVKPGHDEWYEKAVAAGATEAGKEAGETYNNGFTAITKFMSRAGERGEYVSDTPVAKIDTSPAVADTDVDEGDVPF